MPAIIFWSSLKYSKGYAVFCENIYNFTKKKKYNELPITQCVQKVRMFSRFFTKSFDKKYICTAAFTIETNIL